MKNNLIIEFAFKQLQYLALIYADDIPWRAIEKGFDCEGGKIFFSNKARGIFKPKQMTCGVLSIKTTIPREGRVNIYRDAENEKGYFRYSLQQGDPRGGGNKHLWEALEDKTPFIYFYAVAPAIYKALWPCFITLINSEQSYCEVVVGEQPILSISKAAPIVYKLPTPIEREYRVTESRMRIHQAHFREQVLSAYNNQCAITSLPVPTLLEAAHITPDRDPKGEAIVTNGIALSKIHHRAYDANLIGIDSDYTIHISEQLLSLSDGPLLEVGLKAYQGKKISLPCNYDHMPERARLEERFLMFLEEQ